ncbi:MAG: ABC transporter permease [Rhodobacter sp.]|nr:ABC transporter permease [Rhodobacter sp.]
MSTVSGTGPGTADAPSPDDALHEAAALADRDTPPRHGAAPDGPVLAADGTPLKRSLARALRLQKTRALMLIAPLLIFVLISFIVPIAQMLWRSVENDIVSNTLPMTVPELAQWDASDGGLPPEPVFRAMYYDMFLAAEAKKHTRLGTRLNYEQTGISSLFRQSGRKLDDLGKDILKPLRALDGDWAQAAPWFELMSGADGAAKDTAALEAQRDRLRRVTESPLAGEIGFAPSSEISALLPLTAQAYTDFAIFTVLEDGKDLAKTKPWETVYPALIEDMQTADVAGYGGPRAGMLQALRAGIAEFPPPSYSAAFADIDADWAAPQVWQTIQTHARTVTPGYFLNAVDMQLTPDGAAAQPESKQILVKLFGRTLVMSLIIMGSCILLGYPIAYLLANLPMRTANVLLILVLLPFWTSLLVRTSAWKVMLQQQGVINDTLVWLGLVADESRLVMINNQFGTIVAMTHILLPFMILPMYSVMQTIPPSYVRAAKSLGATNWTTFWRVYFPQSVPGIGAGSILVFILAIGYYITPEIVGGTKGVFISNRIAYHISSSLNWGLAAALGTILLAVVLLLYWCYDKIVGIDNVKLG